MIQNEEKMVEEFHQKYGHFKENDRSYQLVHDRAMKNGINDMKVPTRSGEDPHGIYIHCPVYIVSERTAIIPLDGFLPECKIYTTGTRIPRLACSANPPACHLGKNCLGTLLTRLGNVASSKIFTLVSLFVLYWLHDVEEGGNSRKRITALYVSAADSQMKIGTVNPHSLSYFIKSNSKQYELRF